MYSDPDDLRERAREWGRALLLQAPWEPLTERLSLIMVAPSSEATTTDATIEHAPSSARLWMLIDRSSAAGLPEPLRQPLYASGAVIQRHPPTTSTPGVDLAIRTVEAIESQLDGTGRREFELRWLLSHASSVADRLRRLDALALRGRMLPADGLERAVRLLWLDAYAATQSLWALTAEPGHGLIAAGELSGALLRLACLMDEGAYPPADLLRAQAAGTRIGQRLVSWLDDVTLSLTGDEAAARRSVQASPQVLEEVRLVLREHYAERDWLREPAIYELRARR